MRAEHYLPSFKEFGQRFGPTVIPQLPLFVSLVFITPTHTPISGLIASQNGRVGDGALREPDEGTATKTLFTIFGND